MLRLAPHYVHQLIARTLAHEYHYSTMNTLISKTHKVQDAEEHCTLCMWEPGTVLGASVQAQILSTSTCAHSHTHQGLQLLDALYTQAGCVQGTPHYPLLLSLLKQTAVPYLQ